MDEFVTLGLAEHPLYGNLFTELYHIWAGLTVDGLLRDEGYT